MTTYKYRARTGDGAVLNGVVEAYSEYEAVDRIKETCAIVEKITEVKPRHAPRIDLFEPLTVSDKALSLAASQFAIMARAGLPMVRTVQLVAEQCSDKLLRRVLTQAAGDVAAGYALAQSLERNGGKLPTAFIETVRAGEESGTLDKAFEQLAIYYEKSNKIRQKVRSAMAYPLFLLILAAVVVGVLMVTMVPTLLSVLGGLGNLPLPTRMLMTISDFFLAHWLTMLAIVCALVIAFRVYANTEAGGLAVAKLTLALPVISHISALKSAGQFAGTMSTLLSAGLPVNRCLSITAKVMDNRAVSLSLSKAVGLVETGSSLQGALAGNPYLPPMLLEMTAIGEESGALDDTLSTVGAFFDSETETASAKALSMLEPMITIFLGLIIGFIVIALYSGIFSMTVTVA